MKVYNIIIQPDVKLHREQITRLANEINLRFHIRALVYDDVFSFSKESLRISFEDIIEDVVPDLLMYLDNITWEGYKVINAFEVGDVYSFPF